MRSARAGFGSLLPQDFDWSTFEGHGKRTAERIADQDVRVAVVDDLSGYGVFGALRDEDSEGGEVWTLFVDPPAWGAGVGDALMGNGLGWLIRRGFHSVAVWSFVENGRARRFYERWRFRPDGARSSLAEFAGLEVERLVRAVGGGDDPSVEHLPGL